MTKKVNKKPVVKVKALSLKQYTKIIIHTGLTWYNII